MSCTPLLSEHHSNMSESKRIGATIFSKELLDDNTLVMLPGNKD